MGTCGHRPPIPGQGSQGTGISAARELTPEGLDLDARTYSTEGFIHLLYL